MLELLAVPHSWIPIIKYDTIFIRITATTNRTRLPNQDASHYDSVTRLEAVIE